MAEPTYKKPTSTATYEKTDYTSQYQPQIDAALNKVTNWTYNPLEDASYKALAQVYNKRGEQAAKNTMADAASLNGGYGTSYAVSAANQARNDYNQELASYIPDLEDRAYNRNVNTLSALQDAESTSYNRYRDTVSDNQWQYNIDYSKYRDDVSDAQWNYSNEYQAYRDKIADAQWQKEYDLSKKNYYSSVSSTGGAGGYTSYSNSNDYATAQQLLSGTAANGYSGKRTDASGKTYNVTGQGTKSEKRK